MLQCTISVIKLDYQSLLTELAECSIPTIECNLHRMNAERDRVVALLVVVERHCRAWSTDNLCRECFQLH